MFTCQFSSNGFVLFVLFFITLNATSAQPKGYLYDEQKVRHYTLPNPLVCEDGSTVTDSMFGPKREDPKFYACLKKKYMGVRLESLST